MNNVAKQNINPNAIDMGSAGRARRVNANSNKVKHKP